MVPVSHPLICSRLREIRTRRCYRNPGWRNLPVGEYYEGLVDDATAVVERLTAETVTTFGTRRSQQLQLSQADKENISVKDQNDEVSYTRCMVRAMKNNVVDNINHGI